MQNNLIPKGWRQLLAAENISPALVTHFHYLADSPGYERVLEAVMHTASDISCDAHELRIIFNDKMILHASPPAAQDTYRNWPESFRALVLQHEKLEFPNNTGQALILGAGDLDPYDFEHPRSQLLDYINGDSGLQCPITDYSDWLVYHPGINNLQQQPALCFFSHAGGDIEAPLAYNAGSYFLRRMAEILGLSIQLPVITTIPEQEFEQWCRNLTPPWKTALLRNDQASDHQLSEQTRLKALLHTSHLYLRDADIDNLAPLSVFQRLGVLECRNLNITSLHSLPELPYLKFLDFKNCPIDDIAVRHHYPFVATFRLAHGNLTSLAGLDRFPGIKELNLSANPITDISILAGLRAIETLNLQETKVCDISALQQIEYLSNVDLSSTPVKDLSALCVLNRLKRLALNDTVIADLPEIMHKKPRSLAIKKTAIPFQKILQLEQNYYDNCEKKLAIEKSKQLKLYSDHGKNPIEFIHAVKSLGGINDIQFGLLLTWVNPLLVTLLKKNIDTARVLLDTVLDIEAQVLTGQVYDKFTILAIICIIGCSQRHLVDKVFSHLLQKPVTHHTIAYNLACFYSQAYNKPQLLRYTRLAIALGHDADEFAADNDFAPYINDNDFLELIT